MGTGDRNYEHPKIYRIIELGMKQSIRVHIRGGVGCGKTGGWDLVSDVTILARSL